MRGAMTDALDIFAATAPLPDLVLYGRPGCGLCAEARAHIVALLAQREVEGRPVPRIVDRDITTDPAWERAYFTTIPVVEIGDRILELATSPARIDALVRGALDPVTGMR
jgi:hypothetical protein